MGKQLFLALGNVDRIVRAVVITPIPNLYLTESYFLPILAKYKVYSVFIRVRYSIDMVNGFKPASDRITSRWVTRIM
jgi:hypothetical protein